MPRRPVISLVAAVARDGAIGRGNDLLVRLPEDQKHFRAVTMGHPVVMGRRTWESLPARFRPLPGRRNIVVSRNADWHAEGAERAASLDEAIAMAGEADKICVIGGGQLYAAAMPIADELLLTEIDAAFPDADTFFPAWDSARFRVVANDAGTAEAGPSYRFVTYQRQPGA